MAVARDASHSAGFSARTVAQCTKWAFVRCGCCFCLPPVKEDREMVGTVSRGPVRRLGCRCSECQAVVFGDLADFLGGELGGVCDDPEWYAAFEQFQRDFFHGVALATCLTACLTVFHCDF